MSLLLFDIILEIVRASVLFCLLLYLFMVGRDELSMTSRGWNWILGGFCLLLFGSLVDITDNFDSLNRFVVIGDTETEAFLEKFVGFLCGFIVLGIGLVLWIPQELNERKQAEQALRASEENLKRQIVDLRDHKERLETQSENLVSMAEDLHAVKEEMKYLANHDALTGLPSLRLCRDRLDSALAGNRRNKTQTAVLFIDLDGFKAINDTLGHDAGDAVLIGVAERLKSTLRAIDTAGRIGGDEFLLLLLDIPQKEDAAIVAIKVIDALSKPFPVNDTVANIGASIGIAISPGDGISADELLRNADESMYGIKQQGKNNYGFYS